MLQRVDVLPTFRVPDLYFLVKRASYNQILVLNILYTLYNLRMRLNGPLFADDLVTIVFRLKNSVNNLSSLTLSFLFVVVGRLHIIHYPLETVACQIHFIINNIQAFILIRETTASYPNRTVLLLLIKMLERCNLLKTSRQRR